MASFDNSMRRKKKMDQEVKNRIKNMSKEEMAFAISKKKECNARAMSIVQQSIEPNVEQVWLLENLKHINQSYFQDIVEERAITKFCGYPLCNEELTNVPRKMYKISTTENKVYDITDRKNYCSNICYKAGTFLKDQLYTSPLWLRDFETPVEFKLLTGAKESKGTGAGAEVDLGNTNPVKLGNLSDTKNDGSETRKAGKKKDNETKTFKHKSPSVDLANKTDIDKEDNNLPSTSKKVDRIEINDEMNSLKGDTLQIAKKIELNLASDKSQPVIRNADSSHSIMLISSQKHSADSISNTIISSSEITSASDNDKIDVLEDASLERIPSNEGDSLFDDRTMPVLEKEVSFEICDNDVSSTTTDMNQCRGKIVPETTDSVNESVSDSVDPCTSTFEQPLIDTCINSESSGHFDSKSQTKEIKTNQITLKKNPRPLRGKLKCKKQEVNPYAGVVYEIEQKIESWFTIESMCYLLGEDKLSELLKMSGFQETLPTKKENHLMYAKYQEIFKRLNLIELKDKEKQIPTKPVPDYSVLRKEAEELELKVKSFFRGDSKVTFALHEGRQEDSMKFDFDLSVVPNLPPIDQYAIMSTRRRIFIEKLSKVLPDMLNALELSQFRLGWEIQELVATFSLGATNIYMRPPEWALAAVVLIKLLTIRNDILNFAYSREITQRRLITYLLTYDLDGGYLDRFTSYLLDIERITALMQLE